MYAPDRSSGYNARPPSGGAGEPVSVAYDEAITFGQYSEKGRKPVNQDFHAIMAPGVGPARTKGAVVALADGISSSEVSQQAAQLAVKGFIDDYYATPESWTVKTSAQRVLQASNSWLYAQTRNGPYRYDLDKGYVCTFSAIVFKSSTAHLLHAGDSRIYRVVAGHLEQLTEDHRLWVSRDKSYLSRALGMRDWLDLDYRTVDLEPGDTFIVATDGVYEFIDEAAIVSTIEDFARDLDLAAQAIVERALENGSDDNLTIQIARVNRLPPRDVSELQRQAMALPFAPDLHARMLFDGYEIQRDLYNSSRSHVYLAVDQDSGDKVVIKVPSKELRDDADYLERFLMEDWVARRIDNPHVLKPGPMTRRPAYLYITTEYVEGQTLRQWMLDNPKPDLETVRGIIDQIARGLTALHRLEMLHQDLRPDNIMIDSSGTLKLIDFGSVKVAGVAEMTDVLAEQQILGTQQYTAPEYFLGESGDWRSDLFSLGVICYQLLSDRLPYGTRVSQATTRAAQHRLVYESVLDAERSIPAWVDGAIRKAVHTDPDRRYDSLSEFLYDLRHPNRSFVNAQRPPLLDSNPILFWKGLSLILFLLVLYLAFADRPVGNSLISKPTPLTHLETNHE
jgi:serine/threonine protein kinase/serine/threonine protein phosphatase PrpC